MAVHAEKNVGQRKADPLVTVEEGVIICKRLRLGWLLRQTDLRNIPSVGEGSRPPGARDRAQKELDNARSLLAQAQKRRNEIENEIKYYTDQDTEELTPDSAQRQRIEDLVGRFKSNLEKASLEEQKAQSYEMQAKDALQIERAKLDALQDELDRLDQSLKGLASQPVN
jgi:phage-related minor tail protein